MDMVFYYPNVLGANYWQVFAPVFVMIMAIIAFCQPYIKKDDNGWYNAHSGENWPMVLVPFFAIAVTIMLLVESSNGAIQLFENMLYKIWPDEDITVAILAAYVSILVAGFIYGFALIFVFDLMRVFRTSDLQNWADGFNKKKRRVDRIDDNIKYYRKKNQELHRMVAHYHWKNFVKDKVEAMTDDNLSLD